MHRGIHRGRGHSRPVATAADSSHVRAMTTVAIVEDHAIVRDSLCEWVNATPGCRCVCTCGSAEEALKEIPRLAPDVVLMDIHLPGESGIVCTARLKKSLPKLNIIMV